MSSEQYRRQLIHKPKAVILVDQLFINPYMSVSRSAQILAVSNPTARQVIRTLEDANTGWRINISLSIPIN